MAMQPASDSTFDRALRMLRELPPAERLEAAAYAVAIELEQSHRTRSLEGLILDLRGRVREIQARARG